MGERRKKSVSSLCRNSSHEALVLFVFIEKEIARCQYYQKVLDPLELVLLSRYFATGDHRAGTENILQSLTNFGSLRI